MDGEEETARLEDLSLLFLSGDVEAHLGLNGARVAGEKKPTRPGALVDHDVLHDVGVARRERARRDGRGLVLGLGRGVYGNRRTAADRKEGEKDRREVLFGLLTVDFQVARMRVPAENDDHSIRMDLLHQLPDALVVSVHRGVVAAHGNQQTDRQRQLVLFDGIIPDIELVFVLRHTKKRHHTGVLFGELERSIVTENSGSWELLETVRSLFRPMK